MGGFKCFYFLYIHRVVFYFCLLFFYFNSISLFLITEITQYRPRVGKDRSDMEMTMSDFVLLKDHRYSVKLSFILIWYFGK